MDVKFIYLFIIYELFLQIINIDPKTYMGDGNMFFRKHFIRK